MKKARACRFSPVAFVAFIFCHGVAYGQVQPTPVNSQFNIIGVRTGQTPDEVVAALKAAEPGGELREGRAKDPAGHTYVGRVEYYFNRMDSTQPGVPVEQSQTWIVFSSPATNNLAIAVRRSADYHGNSAPLIATLKSALVKKYGVGTWESGDINSTAEFYGFGVDGKPIGKRGESRQCSVQNNEFDNLTSFSGACGNAVFGWVIEGRETAGNLIVMMKDEDLARHSMEADDQAAKKAGDQEMQRRKSLPVPQL